MAQVNFEIDSSAFREGIFVRALGRECSSNPYAPGSREAKLWESGWRFVDARQAPIKSVPDFKPADGSKADRSQSPSLNVATVAILILSLWVIAAVILIPR